VKPDISRTPRSPASRRDWTKGSIVRNLLSLYWPLLVGNSVNMLGPTIDMIWVGKLGAASVAGVGVSAIAIMVVNSLQMGLFTGTTALIARFVGAGDETNANRVAQQAFVIGTGISVILALIGIFLSRPILIALGVEPDVVAQGTAYMQIQLVGMVTMVAILAGQSIMNASGDTKATMKISVGYRLFHVALCPALIFGPWIFPEMGVQGAALSNVISQAVGGGFALWILFTGRTRLRVTLKHFRFDRNLIWRTVKIGIPASITQVERSFSELVLVRLIIPFGTFSVAAHSIAQRVDQFIMVPCAGLGTSAGVLAGQNLGANQPERASRTGWLAAGLASILTVAFAIVIFFWADDLVNIFTPDTEVISIGSIFLRIQIPGYIMWGMVIAFSMCLNSTGDTMITMITNLTTMWGISITLAFILSRYTSLEVNGIRWAMVAGILVRAVIYTIYFQTGRWQRKKV
jgi:putative MATE family efflux protein